jgi:hypothetical protein
MYRQKKREKTEFRKHLKERELRGDGSEGLGKG